MAKKVAEESVKQNARSVNAINIKLHNLLRSDAEARKAKALMSLHLLDDKAVGIGDHSTEDFYNNAKEALSELATAEDELSTLDKYVSGDYED